MRGARQVETMCPETDVGIDIRLVVGSFMDPGGWRKVRNDEEVQWICSKIRY